MSVVEGKFITGPDGGFLLVSRVTGARMTVSGKKFMEDYPGFPMAHVYIEYSMNQAFMPSNHAWAVPFDDVSCARAYLDGVREAVGLPPMNGVDQ